MSKSENFLVNILIAINNIKRRVSKIKTLDDFIVDKNVFNSVVRELKVIGKSAEHLLKDRILSKINWHEIVDVLDKRLNVETVFEIVKNKIPQLEEDLMNLIRNLRDKEPLLSAIELAKDEVQNLSEFETADFLESIQDLLKT